MTCYRMSIRKFPKPLAAWLFRAWILLASMVLAGQGPLAFGLISSASIQKEEQPACQWKRLNRHRPKQCVPGNCTVCSSAVCSKLGCGKNKAKSTQELDGRLTPKTGGSSGVGIPRESHSNSATTVVVPIAEAVAPSAPATAVSPATPVTPVPPMAPTVAQP